MGVPTTAVCSCQMGLVPAAEIGFPGHKFGLGSAWQTLGCWEKGTQTEVRVPPQSPPPSFAFPNFPSPLSNPRAAQRKQRLRLPLLQGNPKLCAPLLSPSFLLLHSGERRGMWAGNLPACLWPAVQTEQAQPDLRSPSSGTPGCGSSMGASVPPPAQQSGPRGRRHNSPGPRCCALRQSAAPPLPALRPARSLARRAAADSIASFMSLSLSSRHSPPPPSSLFFSSLPSLRLTLVKFLQPPPFFFSYFKESP